MGYILDLRKIVGKRTLIMPCSCVIIGDGNGNILLQHRVDNGLWSYHGGSIEIDEEVTNAVRREVLEELGIELEELNFLNIYSGKDMHYTYPNGDDVSSIDIVYYCHKYRGEFVYQKEEVKEVAWFNEDTIPDNMTPQNKRVIKDYFKLLKE